MTTVAFGKTLPSAGLITVPPTSDIRSARSAAVKSKTARNEGKSKFHARDSPQPSHKDYGAASDSARNDKRLFLRFRHGFLGSLKTDFGMGAVAKRFLSRCAAAAEGHPFFHRILVSISVDQLDFARHDVGTVLDCFDCYLSHVCILRWIALSSTRC